MVVTGLYLPKLSGWQKITRPLFNVMNFQVITRTYDTTLKKEEDIYQDTTFTNSYCYCVVCLFSKIILMRVVIFVD